MKLVVAHSKSAVKVVEATTSDFFERILPEFNRVMVADPNYEVKYLFRRDKDAIWVVCQEFYGETFHYCHFYIHLSELQRIMMGRWQLKYPIHRACFNLYCDVEWGTLTIRYDVPITVFRGPHDVVVKFFGWDWEDEVWQE